jgi:hypothetical protein
MRGMVQEVGLRFFQVQISVEQALHLPGVSMLEDFTKIELINNLDSQSLIAKYLLRVEFDNPDVFESELKSESSLIIKEIILRRPDHAYIIAELPGPLSSLVQSIPHCWLTAPTSLTVKNGLFWTVQGTPRALKRTRDELVKMIPTEIRMRISKNLAADWISAPVLPPRRHEVMARAVNLGYYSTPRSCTQREIAESLNIRQGTVAEHLQSAESVIIQSWSKQSSD